MPNQKLPVPIPENALSEGVIREQFSLENGIRKYRFEIEWTENMIRVLNHAQTKS
jgi:hypothetical protein